MKKAEEFLRLFLLDFIPLVEYNVHEVKLCLSTEF